MMETAAYLEGCLFTLQHRAWPPSAPRPLKDSFECRLRLQLCATLSHLSRHELALSHARCALSLAKSVVFALTALPRSLLQDSAVAPLWKSLGQHASFKGWPTKPDPVEPRSVLGVLRLDHWAYKFGVGELVTVQGVDPLDFCPPSGEDSLTGMDSLLEKAVLVVVACFSISAEVRFLHGNSAPEGKMWLQRAIFIGNRFLPLESKLVEQVKDCFARSYGGGIKEKRKVGDSSLQSVTKPPPRSASTPKSRHLLMTFPTAPTEASESSFRQCSISFAGENRLKAHPNPPVAHRTASICMEAGGKCTEETPGRGEIYIGGEDELGLSSSLLYGDRKDSDTPCKEEGSMQSTELWRGKKKATLVV